MEKYRTFWPRLVAYVIDGFIMVPIIVTDDWLQQAALPRWVYWIWLPFAAAVQLVYHVWMNARFGQTLGKMYMNVKIVTVGDERDIGWSHAFIRELPQIIQSVAGVWIRIAFLGWDPESPLFVNTMSWFVSIFGAWGLADIAWFAIDQRRRALHDVIAGTVVVRTENRSVPETN